LRSGASLSTLSTHFKGTKQFQQLCDIGRNPPRLIVADQLGSAAPVRFFLEFTQATCGITFRTKTSVENLEVRRAKGGVPMINRIQNFPIVQLLAIVAAGIFTAELIQEVAAGEIWWPF
jgi:hypothetical protein